MITSEAKGIGKSTLGTIIQRLVGERNGGMAQSKDLKSQFDGWLMGKLVVQVDEVYEYGNWDLSNKLKPLITEPTISVNVKYGPQLNIKNFARFIMFSNHTAPIDLEEGDRRYFVFNSEAQPRDTDYYDALNKCIDSVDGMNGIYTWLMQRDISSFRPYAAPPVTEAKSKIIETSGNPLKHYISEIVNNGHLYGVLGRVEFTIDEVQRLLQQEGFGQQAKNVKELSSALHSAGVINRRTSVEGSRIRMWQLPETDAVKASIAACSAFSGKL
jgi:phage/plasmid-associated DNA primase